MVLISHRYKFIYIKCKKVAGTSLEAFFERFCLSEEEESFHNVTLNRNQYISESGVIGTRSIPVDNKIHRVKIPEHVAIRSIASSDVLPIVGLTAETFSKYFKFCAVRNPWEVQVSAYDHACKHPNMKKTFEEFLRLGCIVNSDIYTIDGKPACDFYIRYEHLQDDLQTVIDRLGLICDPSSLPRYRSENRVHYDYRSMYTDELRHIVASQCATEIQQFGYKF